MFTPEAASKLNRYHIHHYPTPANESYMLLVKVLDQLLNSLPAGSPPLECHISCAAAGELAKCLEGRHVRIGQSDLRPGQAPGIGGIDDDAWPLDQDGHRVPEGSVDLGLFRNCCYDLHAAFLTFRAAVGVLREGGTIAFCVLREQLGNAAPFILEAGRIGVLCSIDMKGARLRTGSTDENAFLFTATRTGIPYQELQNLPLLLTSSCGWEELTNALHSGVKTAVIVEKLRCLPPSYLPPIPHPLFRAQSQCDLSCFHTRFLGWNLEPRQVTRAHCGRPTVRWPQANAHCASATC